MKFAYACAFLAAGAALVAVPSEAFAPAPGRTFGRSASASSAAHAPHYYQQVVLSGSINENMGDGVKTDGDHTIHPHGLRRKLRRKLRLATMGVATAISLHNVGTSSLPSITLRPPSAVARVPIDAVQDTNLDLKQIGMERAIKAREEKRSEEALAHRTECDKIESTQGTKARKQYEATYAAKFEAKKDEKAIQRSALLNKLLDEGICPFTDTEGIRQLFLMDEEIDLAEVEGSEQYYDFVETMAGKGARVSKTYALPRFIVKAQVDDLRARGIDPVQYFKENQPKTLKLFRMPDRQLKAIADQYKARITENGHIKPVTGDEALAATATNQAKEMENDPEAAKAASKAEKLAAKAQAKAAKEGARAEKLAKRIRRKEERIASRKEKKAAKVAVKAGAAAAAMAAANVASDSKAAVDVGLETMTTKGHEVVAPSNVGDGMGGDTRERSEGFSDSDATPAGTSGQAAVRRTTKKKLPIVPIATVLGVGGGGYLFKTSKDSAAAAEEERQRQFKMIMGMDESDQNDDDDEHFAADTEDVVGSMGSDFPSFEDVKEGKPAASKASSDAAAPTPAPVAKKRFGIKSVFSKKPGRESDLTKLTAPGAKAPEFAATVAKLLTFGAKGRFLAVTALPGGMPMTEFDVEKAKVLLRDEADKASLSDQDACEEFACVVNCMIIEIIDLASSTLGEKEDEPTVNAMNIVMDFMDHAAGLFEPFLTEGVSLKPVTYGGSLGKGKLENLYSTYATAVMTSSRVTEDRIDMFRELFEIKEKKAEGLVQKKMMAQMMKMMKDPEAMKEMMGGEGMEEMMAAMGGMEGLDGMPGMDEEISPEQLKESVNMMKELIDSGSVSKEEMGIVKEQFAAAYGMDMEELIANADSEEVKEQLGEDGEELLEMFKVILKATE